MCEFKLAGYTNIELLGEGTFADVYKMKRDIDGDIMAIKVLRDRISELESSYEDFYLEYQLLQYLNIKRHPNIINTYGFMTYENHAVIQMEYVNGKTVGQYLKDNLGFVTIDEVFRILQEIGSALKYCHYDISHNYLNDNSNIYNLALHIKSCAPKMDIFSIVHNDIYHSNIMRRQNGSFVLIDFGFSLINNINVTIKGERRTNGRPDFKAPEKWLGIDASSPAVDIYSFGIVLYEILTGRLPFIFDKTKSEKIALEELYNSVMHESPHPVYEYRKAAFENKFPDIKYEKDYPDWLENLIMKCLEKNPKDRFADGYELYNYTQNICNLFY